MVFTSFSIYKSVILCSLPLLSHQTSSTPTMSNLYLAKSLATVLSDPILFRLLTFHELSLKFIFQCWGCTNRSVQIQGTAWHFRTWWILWRVVSHFPNLQPGDSPLVSCPGLLIPHVHTYRSYLEAVSFVHHPRTCHVIATGSDCSEYTRVLELRPLIDLHWLTIRGGGKSRLSPFLYPFCTSVYFPSVWLAGFLSIYSRCYHSCPIAVLLLSYSCPIPVLLLSYCCPIAVLLLSYCFTWKQFPCPHSFIP